VSVLQYFRPSALLPSSMLVSAAACCALMGPNLAAGAEATVNEKFADAEPAIQMLRDEAGKDRRDVVKRSMLLTESESKMFWPLYDEYRADMSKLGDRRVKLITDFAANKDGMSQDEAARLTQEAFDIDKEKIKVREEYVKKMTKVLSSRTVARFFHIDSKLDAIVNAQLAANIPLIH